MLIDTKIPYGLTLAKEINIKGLQDYYSPHLDALQTEFLEFKQLSTDTLNQAKQLLKHKSDMELTQLEIELAELTSILFSIGECRTNAEAYQTIFEIVNYQPKPPQKEASESDRKLSLNVRTINQNNLFRHLKNMEDKLEKRISVFQSILKAETARLEKAHNL